MKSYFLKQKRTHLTSVLKVLVLLRSTVVPVVGVLEVGLVEGLLCTSLRTPHTRAPFSHEEVPKVEGPIPRLADLERRSYII